MKDQSSVEDSVEREKYCVEGEAGLIDHGGPLCRWVSEGEGVLLVVYAGRGRR